jgi:SAM-dependent methyltransferase
MISAAIDRIAAGAIGVVLVTGVARTADVGATQPSSPPASVSTLESPSRAVFKYRVAIASLLELKPGMVAADVGAGSGFIARLLALQVAPNGRVIATDRDPVLVSYIEEKAKADGLQNVWARLAPADGTGLEPGAVDALVAVELLGARVGAEARRLNGRRRRAARRARRSADRHRRGRCDRDGHDGRYHAARREWHCPRALRPALP